MKATDNALNRISSVRSVVSRLTEGTAFPVWTSSVKEECVSYSEFTALAAGFMAELYNAARRMTGDAQEAEDLVQDTYTRALRTWCQLNDAARCRAWLYQIMRRLWVDAYRRKKRRPDIVAHEEDDPQMEERWAEWSEGSEQEVLRRMSAEAVHQALTLLPEDLRTALLLCDVDGFTYPEIAAIMECPIGTVRSRIARARQRMMLHLGEQRECPGSRKKGEA